MNTMTLGGNDLSLERANAASEAFNRAQQADPDSQEAPPRPHWSSARAPFWWAFIATIVISALGAAAIYFIHRTTPATSASPLPVASSKSKTPPSAGADAAAVAGQGSQPVSSAVTQRNSGNTPSPSAGGTVAGAAIASSDAGLNKSAVPGSPNASGANGSPPKTATASPNNTANTAANTTANNTENKTTGIGQDNTPGASSERTGTKGVDGAIQWSKANPVATPKEASAAKDAAAAKDSKSTKTDPNKAAAEASKANSPKVGSRPNNGESGPSFPPKSAGATNAAGNPEKRPTATSSSSAASSAPTVLAEAGNAAAPAGRLRPAQDSQCGESNFFQRLACDERVKQRFCRDRWNEHQDCAIQKPRDL